MAALSQRTLARCCRVCLAAGLLSAGLAPARATRPRANQVRLTAWDAAVQARAAFESQPRQLRTRAAYSRVISGFRAIYHDDPAAAHAAKAVEQVAELLAEEAHDFSDPKALRDAAGQREFLVKAYPHSPEAKAARVAPLLPVAAPRPIIPAKAAPAAAFATLSGIRHWSTTSYTRVVIDLPSDSGGDVTYQASRVVNPDRIFVDLHQTRLAAGLAGKSFSVTDDGFLTRIRAAQATGDVTRVVLDVHAVAEYSAFLLPNPERLIIDIHGRPEPQVADAPVVRTPALPAANRPSTTGSSSLPPMPVTDGSASFGLEARGAANTKDAAAPRVVIPSKATPGRPVPNTSTSESTESGMEVAAVSRQAGKVDATASPTAQPVASGSGDHYRKPLRTNKSTASASPSAAKRSAGEPMAAAPPTADGETSLVRALGLKIGRIVIDAGHGGHDSGTLGVDGIEEKDVVLDVALRLGKLLHERLGAEVVYTRADDTFIPLETRTAIANKAQADLFVSIHANSSPDASARGVEVYYLNFTSDPDAMTVASRENAVSTQSVHELSDLVKKIALKDKIEESKELAADVDSALYAGLRKGNDGLKDRGIKKAPFVVLIGANMPSILAEISFVTNPDDADQLVTPAYKERVAESLFAGVKRYEDGINAGGGLR